MDYGNNDLTNMRMVEKKSGLPILAFGAVWLGCSLLFPLYKPGHFVAVGIASLVAFFALSKAIPAKVEYLPVQDTPANTGSADADALLNEGKRLIGDIKAARQTIRNTGVNQEIAKLEGLAARILAFVAQNPEAAPDLRRFLNYYLPTLLKLVRNYGTLEAQGVSGGNITQTMSKIDDVLDTMTVAFERQLDALFADTALDIATDITVMEGMLAQEGLSDSGNTLGFN